MESKNELNERIMAVVTEIQENYPELNKYITEMTEGIPNEKDPHVHKKELKEYYESLLEMVKKYKEGQDEIPQENKMPAEKIK